ncbi:MAG: hypothetical protein ABSF84_06235 [Acidimicrobiales bacterium]
MVPLLALGVVAGCSSSTSGRVAVVGDSLTAIEHPYLSPALERDYTTTYLVRAGGRIAGMSALLQAYVGADGTPGVAVTNLGTTDALAPTRSTASGAVLQPLVTATASIPCVVLTTVSLRADQAAGDDVAAQVDHRIVALERSDPTKYKIVDWNHFLSTLPAPSVPTYLRAGGILETESGAMWLAKADEAAVRACGTAHQPTVIGANPG